MGPGVLWGMRIHGFALAAVLLLPAVARAQLTTGTTDVVLHDKSVVRVESGQRHQARAQNMLARVFVGFANIDEKRAAFIEPALHLLRRQCRKTAIPVHFLDPFAGLQKTSCSATMILEMRGSAIR